MLEAFNLNSFKTFSTQAKTEINNIENHFKTLNKSAQNVEQSIIEISVSFSGIVKSAKKASTGINKMFEGLFGIKDAASSAYGGLSTITQALGDLRGADGFDGGFAAGKKAAGGFMVLTENLGKMGDSLSNVVKGYGNAKKGVLGMWISMNKMVDVAKKTPGREARCFWLLIRTQSIAEGVSSESPSRCGRLIGKTSFRLSHADWEKTTSLALVPTGRVTAPPP